VWMPDERCRVLRRRLARREQLVRSRTRARNEIQAVLQRRLQGRPPCSDLFGVKGRRWLAGSDRTLVEAAWSVVGQPGPLHAFYDRTRARRGHGKAIVATARKLAILFWCMLTRGEDYAHQQPSLTNKKLRRPEITAGAPARKASRPASGAPTRGCAKPKGSSPRRPRPPTSGSSPTGRPQPRRERWARA
jgi:hypothetical protein